jgi:hypothetical protein
LNLEKAGRRSAAVRRHEITGVDLFARVECKNRDFRLSVDILIAREVASASPAIFPYLILVVSGFAMSGVKRIGFQLPSALVRLKRSDSFA